MALENLRGLYQQVILERYKKPHNRGKTDPIHRHQRGHNPSCGDTVDLTLQLDETGDRIVDVKFEGEGCAIALASVDLMADALRGQSVPDAMSLIEQFQQMMQGKAEFPKSQRALNVMQGVAQFPVRIKCATLPWHTVKYAIELPIESIDQMPEFVSNENND